MGIMSKINTSISNMIESAASEMANLSNSFVYSGSAVLNTGVSSNLGKFVGLSDTVYFDYLQQYHFLSSVLDIFESCISEVINKNKFTCTITGDENHTNKANDLIDKLQLKKWITDNLRDIIYRGVYAVGIDYQKGELYSLENPYDVKIYTNTRDIVGYEVNGKYVTTSNLVVYYYKTMYDDVISKKKDKDIPKELKSSVVKYKKFLGKGLFNDKLFRIFQLFSLEYALYYLGLRESMKPTLLSMSTGGRNVNAANAIDMCNKVEAILNEPTTGLAQINDPVAYMNQLVFTLLNNVKVVPSIEEYNNISDINAGELNAKREKLQAEKDAIQKQILNELTIPEELYGGNSNRWEQYSRSDRFSTTIDSILSSITRFVKQIISKYTGISTVSINFDLDTSLLVSSFDTRNKVSQAVDKIADINRLVGSIKEFVENEYVIPEKAYEYLRSQIIGIDSKLADALRPDLDTDPENEGNDNEEGGNENENGGDIQL